jgi:hypothetical protein
MIRFDAETIARLRALGPRRAYDEVRSAIHRIPGGASSEDFQQAFETLVDHGVLSWEQIEQFEET